MSCASPALRFDRAARSMGFERYEIEGLEFRHAVFSRSLAPEHRPRPKVLHVYLSDDGSPWIERSRVGSDPTPRNRLVLELMAGDPAPAVLVGRPCYHLTDPLAGACTPLLWTHQRYSEAVVESLVEALRELLDRKGHPQVNLFGYSGGGVLAMLVAERLPQVRAVVTVAANLDTEAWSEHHGYTPLRGSLNPATRPRLPSETRQLHVAGERDEVVPVELSRAFVDGRPEAELRIFPKADHSCCWREIWPEVLEWVRSSPDPPPSSAAARAP